MVSKHPISLTFSILALSLPLLAAYPPVQAASEAVVHNFSGYPNDGADPESGLIGDSARNGYGTTFFGGANGYGAVYKITQTGQETVFYAFAPYGSGDGSSPQAGVILGKDGSFYGTTYNGGTYGFGTVYKITLSGQETVLHSFNNDGTDGVGPYAPLVQDKTGYLYGTTVVGGSSGPGTIFRITL